MRPLRERKPETTLCDQAEAIHEMTRRTTRKGNFPIRADLCNLDYVSLGGHRRTRVRAKALKIMVGAWEFEPQTLPCQAIAPDTAYGA